MNNHSTFTMYPEYSTVLFCQIWEDVVSFKEDLNASPFADALTDDSKTKLFYLLYARYGNNPIANRDITQWKFKVFSTIYQYGPTWEKRTEIQKKLRDIPDEELLLGSKAIYNHAYNPGTAPSNSATLELNYINDQNTSHFKKSKMEAYAQLWSLLKVDVVEEFLNKFKKLFKIFVSQEQPLLYETEGKDTYLIRDYVQDASIIFGNSNDITDHTIDVDSVSLIRDNTLIL